MCVYSFVVKGAGIAYSSSRALRLEVVGDRCGTHVILVGSCLSLLLSTSSFFFFFLEWQSSWSLATSSLTEGAEAIPCIERCTTNHSCVRSNPYNKMPHSTSLTVVLLLWLNLRHVSHPTLCYLGSGAALLCQNFYKVLSMRAKCSLSVQYLYRDSNFRADWDTGATTNLPFSSRLPALPRPNALLLLS